jgi:hypothetical protein
MTKRKTTKKRKPRNNPVPDLKPIMDFLSGFLGGSGPKKIITMPTSEALRPINQLGVFTYEQMKSMTLAFIDSLGEIVRDSSTAFEIERNKLMMQEVVDLLKTKYEISPVDAAVLMLQLGATLVRECDKQYEEDAFGCHD